MIIRAFIELNDKAFYYIFQAVLNAAIYYLHIGGL